MLHSLHACSAAARKVAIHEEKILSLNRDMAESLTKLHLEKDGLMQSLMK